LKERNPDVSIVCADPYGAAMWSWFTNGNTDTDDGDSFAEGIGQGRVTKNLEDIVVDRAYRIPDQEALTIIYQLLREEGIFLGLSSGINIAGAVRFARSAVPARQSSLCCATPARNISRSFSIPSGSPSTISIPRCRSNPR